MLEDNIVLLMILGKHRWILQVKLLRQSYDQQGGNLAKMIFGTMKQVKRPVRWRSAKKKGTYYYSHPKTKLQQMEKRLRRGKW